MNNNLYKIYNEIINDPIIKNTLLKVGYLYIHLVMNQKLLSLDKTQV